MSANPTNDGSSGLPNQAPDSFQSGSAGQSASLEANRILIPQPTQEPNSWAWVGAYSPMRILISAVPGGQKWAILADSGAHSATVDSSLLKNFEHTMGTLPSPVALQTSAGSVTTDAFATFSFFMEGTTSAGEPAGVAKLSCEALVLHNLPFPMLLGNGWLKPHRCVIDYSNDRLTIGSLGDFVAPTFIDLGVGLDRWETDGPSQQAGPSVEERLLQLAEHENLIPRRTMPIQQVPEGTAEPSRQPLSHPAPPPAGEKRKENPTGWPASPRPIEPNFNRPQPAPVYPPPGWTDCKDCHLLCKSGKNDSCFRCRKGKLEGIIDPGVQSLSASAGFDSAKRQGLSARRCSHCNHHQALQSRDVCISCLVGIENPEKKCARCGWEFECAWDGEKFVHDEAEVAFHESVEQGLTSK